MPGDADVMVLRSSRRRSIVLLFIACAFVSGGVAMIRDGARWGWPATVFFGVCLVFFVITLIRPNKLVLTREGFQTVTFGRPSRVFAWHDCGKFSVSHVAPIRPMVVFDFDGPEVRRHPRLVAMSRGMSGATGALPETYGMQAADLARFLNECQLRATTRPPI